MAADCDLQREPSLPTSAWPHNQSQVVGGMALAANATMISRVCWSRVFWAAVVFLPLPFALLLKEVLTFVKADSACIPESGHARSLVGRLGSLPRHGCCDRAQRPSCGSCISYCPTGCCPGHRQRPGWPWEISRGRTYHHESSPSQQPPCQTVLVSVDAWASTRYPPGSSCYRNGGQHIAQSSWRTSYLPLGPALVRLLVLELAWVRT